MKRLLALFPTQPVHTSVALLAMRVLTGVAFVVHGSSKIANPLHWMDGAASPAPAAFQALAAVAEYVGGGALIVGLATPLAAFGLACTMLVAVFTHASKGDGFIGKGGSWELAGVYLVIALVILTAGPGRFALDTLWVRRAAKSAPTP